MSIKKVGDAHSEHLRNLNELIEGNDIILEIVDLLRKRGYSVSEVDISSHETGYVEHVLNVVFRPKRLSLGYRTTIKS